ncbi:MAG: hypothetical protein JWM59_3621 [Verrucomicrobiales bacterium]|nr:hypothetical protein [Verrucomicrobiales bacterium]
MKMAAKMTALSSYWMQPRRRGVSLSPHHGSGMKISSSPFFLSAALRCAAAVAVCAVALPEAAVAGNPLRSLKSKVKGEVNRVKRIVQPRRAVAVLRHGAASTVEWINPGQPRPVRRPGDVGASRGDDGAEDGESLRQRPHPPEGGSRLPVREREPQPPPRRHAEGEERSDGDFMQDRQPDGRSRGVPEHEDSDSGREKEFRREERRGTPEIAGRREQERRGTRPAPPSPGAAASAQPRPQPALVKTASPPEPSRLTESEESTVEAAPPPVSARAVLSPEKRGTREDLPFGQPVLGRAGLVYSPHARDSLVNVADIPSGTRVKCPYTRKHFRVP